MDVCAIILVSDDTAEERGGFNGEKPSNVSVHISPEQACSCWLIAIVYPLGSVAATLLAYISGVACFFLVFFVLSLPNCFASHAEVGLSLR